MTLNGPMNRIDSTREAVAADKARGAVEEGKLTLLETRRTVVAGWRAVSERLRADGYHGLAEHVDRFVDRMPPVQTDREAFIENSFRPFRPRSREPPARTR
jgi:hypothetical protein